MSAAVSYPEGTLLGGKYRVIRKLGEGGMGQVVLAKHTELDQQVAIKVLRADLADDRASVERFLREARAVARIDSDHVVRVFDVGRFEDGLPYIIMEYLEGEDLAQRLERGPLPVEEAVGHVLQACAAVAEAHRVGIIHRDLKPSNLFHTRRRDGTSVLKVVDFGISKVMPLAGRPEAVLTNPKALLGSPFYMAPEQLMADTATDGRTDVWALGLVLFELVTGEGPFEADTLPALCARILNAPARKISEVRPGVEYPPGLEDVIDLCLAKDPKARFADAVDLAIALAPFGIDAKPAASTRASASNLPTKPPAARDLDGNALPPLRSTSSGVGPLPAERMTIPAGADEAQTLPRKAGKRVAWLPWLACAAGALVVLAIIVSLVRGGGGAARPGDAPVSSAVPPVVVAETSPRQEPPPAATQDSPPVTVSEPPPSPSSTHASIVRPTASPTPAVKPPQPSSHAVPAAPTDEFGGRK